MTRSKHSCRRFRRELGFCPFRLAGLKDKDEEDDPAERMPRAVEVGRKADQLREGRDLTDFLKFGFPAKKRRNKQGKIELGPLPDAIGIPAPAIEEKIAAITAVQEKGGLEFLPNGMGSRLLERGPQGLTAALAAILVTEGLRRSAGIPLRPSSNAVAASERRAAGRLRQLPQSSISGASGRPSLRGRGGFTLNAARELAMDLGFAR